MASAFDKYLNILRKGPEQQQREASPVLTALNQRRQPTADEIREQEKLNREAGVTLPRFQGSLKMGQRLKNIGGLTYVVDDNVPVAPSERMIPRPTMRPTDAPIRPSDLSASIPEPVATAPQMREQILEDALSVAPPAMPQPAMPAPPVSAAPQPGLFQNNLPAPQPQAPTMNDAIDQLIAETMMGQAAPEVPPQRMPTQRPINLPMPGVMPPPYVPPGLMTPPPPSVPNPAMQTYLPDMFRGQLPMPEPTQYDSDPLGIEDIPMITDMPSSERVGMVVDEQGNLVDSRTGQIIIPNYQRRTGM